MSAVGHYHHRIQDGGSVLPCLAYPTSWLRMSAVGHFHRLNAGKSVPRALPTLLSAKDVCRWTLLPSVTGWWQCSSGPCLGKGTAENRHMYPLAHGAL